MQWAKKGIDIGGCYEQRKKQIEEAFMPEGREDGVKK